MKKIWYILLMVIGLTVNSLGSSRSDVKIIEATENIRYLGQKISKDYLYFYYNPKKRELKEQLLEDIKVIEQSIDDISMSTTSIDSKNILDFLTYNTDEIKALIEEKSTQESSILMLDYSESFLEGANSIALAHKYEFTSEEKMLMEVKEFEYLLERVSKYYIASNLNLDKFNNFKHMGDAIVQIENILKAINKYDYPKELKEERTTMNKSWKVYREFLYKSQKASLPNLVLLSEKNLKKIVEKIALYHKKNQ